MLLGGRMFSISNNKPLLSILYSSKPVVSSGHYLIYTVISILLPSSSLGLKGCNGIQHTVRSKMIRMYILTSRDISKPYFTGSMVASVFSITGMQRILAGNFHMHACIYIIISLHL